MVESMDNSFLADENTSLVTDMSLEEDCQEGGALPNQRPKRRRVEGGKKTRFLGELLQKFNNIQQNYNDNSKEMLNIMKQSVENDASIIEVLKEQTNVLRDLLNK
ncbi:uncharacterized protein LOC129218185 [Uloborus diversus]|nr:uncharacterized protein LOC129218185 [Uloborus diversus]